MNIIMIHSITFLRPPCSDSAQWVGMNPLVHDDPATYASLNNNWIAATHIIEQTELMEQSVSRSTRAIVPTHQSVE